MFVPNKQNFWRVLNNFRMYNLRSKIQFVDFVVYLYYVLVMLKQNGL